MRRRARGAPDPLEAGDLTGPGECRRNPGRFHGGIGLALTSMGVAAKQPCRNVRVSLNECAAVTLWSDRLPPSVVPSRSNCRRDALLRLSRHPRAGPREPGVVVGLRRVAITEGGHPAYSGTRPEPLSRRKAAPSPPAASSPVTHHHHPTPRPPGCGSPRGNCDGTAADCLRGRGCEKCISVATIPAGVDSCCLSASRCREVPLPSTFDWRISDSETTHLRGTRDIVRA